MESPLVSGDWHQTVVALLRVRREVCELSRTVDVGAMCCQILERDDGKDDIATKPEVQENEPRARPRRLCRPLSVSSSAAVSGRCDSCAERDLVGGLEVG